MRTARLSSAFVCLLACGGALAQTEFLVSDGPGNKVVRFRWPSGKAINHFVGNGISPLYYSGDMAIGPDQKVYVAGRDGHDILRYDLVTGEFLGEFIKSGAGGLIVPAQFAWGPEGDLYVASWPDGGILRYDAQSGVFQKVVVPEGKAGLDGASGLVFDSEDTFIVSSSENDRLFRFDTDGNLVNEISVAQTGLDLPARLVRAESGKIYVVGYGSDSIIVIDANDQADIFVHNGEGGLDGPSGLAFDPDGNLVVCSVGGNGSLLEYDGTFGTFVRKILVGGDGGMSDDPEGVLFLPKPDDCKADFDHNGILDLFDFLAFVNAFNAGC